MVCEARFLHSLFVNKHFPIITKDLLACFNLLRIQSHLLVISLRSSDNIYFISYRYAEKNLNLIRNSNSFKNLINITMPKNKKKLKQDPAATIGSFSKNLLGLKFMQRAKKEVEKVAEAKDGSFDSSLCSDMKNKQQYIINPSYQFCERLRFGRFSFKGMNTDIETIMFNNKTEKELSIAAEKRGPPPSESSSDNEVDNLESDGNEEEEDDDCLENLKL